MTTYTYVYIYTLIYINTFIFIYTYIYIISYCFSAEVPNDANVGSGNGSKETES